MKNSRNLTVDAARGLAVFGMLCPNMISVLEGTAPFWLRFYGSLAAPFFVILAGMMISLTTNTKHYGESHFVKRGLLLLLTAGLVDIFINHYIPFMCVDILYLVGVGLPIAGLCRRSAPQITFLLALAIVVGAGFLRQTLGYTDYPNEYYWWGARTFIPENPSSVFHHWIVDGWFPLFPWLGMMMFGLSLGTLKRKQANLFATPKFALGGLALIGVGIVTWVIAPPPAWVRGDYSEIFYPPAAAHLFVAGGLLVSVMALAERSPKFFFWRAIRPLGEASLFFYILHLAIINYVIRPLFGKLPLGQFLCVTFLFALGIIALGHGLHRWKASRPRMKSYAARFYLGG